MAFIPAAELTDTVSTTHYSFRAKAPEDARAGRPSSLCSTRHLRHTNSMVRIRSQASQGEREGPSPRQPPQEAVRCKGPAPAPGRHSTPALGRHGSPTPDRHCTNAPSCSGTGGQTPAEGRKQGLSRALHLGSKTNSCQLLRACHENLRITWEHISTQAFPSGSVVKNLSANAGDTGSIPGLGRSPGEGNSLLQYSCLKMPWTEEPGRLQSPRWKRFRHD